MELPELGEFARLLGLGDEFLPRKKDPSNRAAMEALERLRATFASASLMTKLSEKPFGKVAAVEAVLKALEPAQEHR